MEMMIVWSGKHLWSHRVHTTSATAINYVFISFSRSHIYASWPRMKFHCERTSERESKTSKKYLAWKRAICDRQLTSPHVFATINDNDKSVDIRKKLSRGSHSGPVALMFDHLRHTLQCGVRTQSNHPVHAPLPTNNPAHQFSISIRLTI